MNRHFSLKNFVDNPCSWYFGLWCLYSLQGVVYPTGSIISQAILLIIFIISSFYAYKELIKKKKPLYLRGLNLMLLMFTVYGTMLFITDGTVVHGAAFNVKSMSYLKSLYISVLPVYPCYAYAKRGCMNARMLKPWAIIFLLLSIVYYYMKQKEGIAALAETGSTREEITNNAGYVLLLVLPMMMVFDKQPLIQLTYIVVCTVFIILGMKRGAILIEVMCLFMFVLYKLKYTKMEQKIVVIAVVCMALVAMVYFVGNLLEESAYFSGRVEETMEGDSSHRDVLFLSFLRKFKEANIFQMIFGRGANSTIKISFNYAHNDWLEILTNQGLLGIGLYFTYWIFFIKTAFRKYYCFRSRFVLLMMFVIFGTRTLFSMSINDMNMYSSAMLGYALADGFRRDQNDL